MERAALAAALLVLAAQQLASLPLLSATFDEANHLASGYTYVATGDYRLNPQHPPVFKLLAGASLLPLAPRLDLDDPAWRAADEWDFARSFLYRNDANRLLVAGRLPAVLLSLLLVVYVWRWAGERHGPAAAALAAALAALCPTVVAHGQLVTFDVPLAAFSTGATYHLWRRVRGGSRAHLALAGLLLGLALGTKFSGLVLVPVVVTLLAGSVIEQRGGVRQATVDLAVLLLIAWGVVQASYASLDPGLYWRGVALVNRDHDPTFPYYLGGSFRPGGFPAYFLVAFFVKTPLAILTTLALAAGLFRRTRSGARLDEAFVLLPAAAWFGATSLLADNLGVRYLLPLYPLAFVFASRCAPWLAAARPRRLIAAALVLWLAAAAARTWPDQLAYFNEAAGGPANGHRWLDDSNIDWSQDVKRLARRLEQDGIGRIKVRLSPHAVPGYYGIDWEPATDDDWTKAPSPGIYAMSTHLLIRGELYAKRHGYATDWLTRYRPIGRVGYSIYLFRFEHDVAAGLRQSSE